MYILTLPMQCGNLAEFPVAAVYISWRGGTKEKLHITQWLENRALSSVQEYMQWVKEAIFVWKTALNWLHMSYVMRSCGTKAMVICIFANLHQNPVVSFGLLYFIVSKNVSTWKTGSRNQHGKNDLVTTEVILKRGGKKHFQRCWFWLNDSSPSVLRVK